MQRISHNPPGGRVTHVLLPLRQEQESDGTIWPPIDHEHVSAEKLDDLIYRILLPPIFSEDVNAFDIVRASRKTTSDALFDSVLQRSGQVAVRVSPSPEYPERSNIVRQLIEILKEGGCTVTQDVKWQMIAISFNPKSQAMARLIIAAENEGVWDCNAVDIAKVL